MTPETSALIATLYPLVALLLIFDSRRYPRPAESWQRIWFRTNAVTSGFGAVASVWAVLICVRSVNEQLTLEGFDLFIVRTAGTALLFGALGSVSYWAADRVVDPWED